MHWDVFAISAAHLYLPKLPWRAHSPNPRETSERMNFNDIDKKTFNLKTVYILISDVFFFIKKNVTKCLGHHYAIWTSDSNILLAQKIFFGPAKGWPSFQTLEYHIYLYACCLKISLSVKLLIQYTKIKKNHVKKWQKIVKNKINWHASTVIEKNCRNYTRWYE